MCLDPSRLIALSTLTNLTIPDPSLSVLSLKSDRQWADAPTRLEHRLRITRSQIIARSNSENRPTCRTRRDIDEPPSSQS
jgi:hypothetical protein